MSLCTDAGYMCGDDPDSAPGCWNESCGSGCGPTPYFYCEDACGYCVECGTGCTTCDGCGNCDASPLGCTDASACNYNSCSLQDDGSCSYGDSTPTCGCYNAPDACGNCANYHGGCTDPNAGGCSGYDSCANYDDGSCYYDEGCGCGSGWSGSLPTPSQVLAGVTYSKGAFTYTGTLQPTTGGTGTPRSKVILSSALGIPIF